VGTDKRQRQKANRAMKQAEVARTERADAVKRNVVKLFVLAVAALGGVVLIVWIAGGFDSETDVPSTTVPELQVTLPPEVVVTTLPNSSSVPSSSPTTSVASTGAASTSVAP
jgi:hypothetical protein